MSTMALAGPRGIALVTGANRGIGLELVRQLREGGYGVVAACRTSSAELDALREPSQASLGTVCVREGVEVTDPAALRRLGASLEGRPLSLLVANAGVLTVERMDDEAWDYDRMLTTIDTNAMGPLMLARELRSALAAGSKCVLVSSLMGSLADNTSGGMYSYRMSKAAANMAFRSMAHDLKPAGIACGIVHPGFVRTDMTAPFGFPGGISAAEAAAGVIARIGELSLETAGRMVAGKSGKEEAW